ncbi:hypothetical protein [Chondromyces apiculatus]|nr:hypothetical protein [Chondromyces apiculatus]
MSMKPGAVQMWVVIVRASSHRASLLEALGAELEALGPSMRLGEGELGFLVRGDEALAERTRSHPDVLDVFPREPPSSH